MCAAHKFIFDCLYRLLAAVLPIRSFCITGPHRVFIPQVFGQVSFVTPLNDLVVVLLLRELQKDENYKRSDKRATDGDRNVDGSARAGVGAGRGRSGRGWVRIRV